MTVQEKFSHADVQLQNMRAERDMLKTAEARLNQEKEGLVREARSQSMLLANLQAIQVSTQLHIYFYFISQSSIFSKHRNIFFVYICNLY